MTILTDIISILPITLTAISAIAVASIAFLNYRSRPILIRTLERHSDDLKNLASRWSGELPVFVSLERGEFPVVSFPLLVESELLFVDIWEHVPKDFNLLETWENFRVIAEKHYAGRLQFLSSIRTEIERLTGLSQSNSIQKRGYMTELSTFLFRDTFEMLKRNLLPNMSLPLTRSHQAELFLLLAGPQVLAAGSEEDIEKVEKVWTTIIKGMEKDNPNLFKAGLTLVEQEKQFWLRREQLQNKINYFSAIPIYSRRCDLVKRAEGENRPRRVSPSRFGKGLHLRSACG